MSDQLTTEITCVYCGLAYPPGTPSHGAQVLTDHIRVCEKHPMRKVEEDRTALRAALAGLVGVSDRDELLQLKGALNAMPMPEADRQITLAAVEVLLQTV